VDIEKGERMNAYIISILVLAGTGLFLLVALVVMAAIYNRLWREYKILRHRYIALRLAHPENEKDIWKGIDDHIPHGGSTGRWNDDEPNWNMKG
jgi:hypothetical protein